MVSRFWCCLHDLTRTFYETTTWNWHYVFLIHRRQVHDRVVSYRGRMCDGAFSLWCLTASQTLERWCRQGGEGGRRGKCLQWDITDRTGALTELRHDPAGRELPISFAPEVNCGLRLRNSTATTHSVKVRSHRRDWTKLNCNVEFSSLHDVNGPLEQVRDVNSTGYQPSPSYKVLRKSSWKETETSSANYVPVLPVEGSRLIIIY